MSRLPNICVSPARDGEKSSPCRNGTQSVVLEVSHQHGLQDLVFAEDLGALGRFKVEGLVLRGDLVLLIGAFGRGGRARASGRRVSAAPRSSTFAAVSKKRAGRHSVIVWMNFLVMESSALGKVATS